MNSVLGLSVVLCALAASPGEGAALAPQSGVVVLKNGHVLAGEITRAGDVVVVTQGPKSELRLPTSEVEFTCRDLDEAYTRKAAELPAGKAVPRLDLADWCLRHDLPAKAAEQLIAAMQLEPQNARIANLEQRLKLYAERPTKRDARRAETPALSPEELDKFTRELPKSTVEKFAATVQPILLNRCATGGCHGPSSTSEFKLLRPAPGQVANRRFTQRNLYAAIQQIERGNAEQSPLLIKPQARHGTAPAAIFDKQSQTQLDQLSAWVRQAVVKSEATQPASIGPTAEQLSQPARSTPEPESSSNRNSPKPASETTPPRPLGANPKPVAIKGFAPRDPFDPEQFNRLHHPQP